MRSYVAVITRAYTDTDRRNISVERNGAIKYAANANKEMARRVAIRLLQRAHTNT